MDGFAFLEEFEKQKTVQITIFMLSSTLDPNDKKKEQRTTFT
jgi:hypothetical protein